MKGFGQYVINNPEDFEYFSKDVKRQITRAAINTVNIEAAYARKNLVAKTQTTFILRNKFTTRNCQFEQMQFRDVKTLNEIQARAGFLDAVDYMRRQDEGGVHAPKAGSRLAVPTDRVRSGKSKYKLVGKRYRLNEIIANKIQGPITNRIVLRSNSKKARSVARAIVASGKNAEGKKKFVHYGKNLFQVNNFRKKGKDISFKIDMLYIMDRPQTRTKPTGFFLPECERPMQAMQSIFNSEMDKAFGK